MVRLLFARDTELPFMHRSIEVSAPATQVDSIVLALQHHPNVVGITRIHGGSVKPPGDTLQLEVLNKGADDVMSAVRQYVAGSSFSVVTEELASITSPAHQEAINNDVDEAIWEELETGLRHNGGITSNFLSLMAIGGVIAAVGYVSFLQMQVAVFIASSIIAPGLEPIAKLPLGIVLHKPDLAWKGFKATLAGYAVLMAAAALTFAVLLWSREATEKTFLENEVTKSLLEVKLMDVIVSVAAAAASIIMYLSYRRHTLAGPLIALILVPATAAAAICAVTGNWIEALNILAKCAMEIGIIVGVGALLIWSKQRTVHKRSPLR